MSHEHGHAQSRRFERPVSRPPGVRPLGAPGQVAVDYEHRVDFERLRRYRLDRAKAALEASEQRFRAALEGGQDAFFVFRSVRDAAGAVVDFDIVELNTRIAGIVERQRELRASIDAIVAELEADR